MSNYGHAVEPDDVSGDVAGSDQPLTPDMLRSSFARLAARDVEARWRASSSSISNPGSGPDELPKQVVHPTCCGAICRNAATDRARALHAALLAAFTRSVATLSNQPARIASQDVILAVDVFVDAAEDAAPDRTKFCALATASGRFNRFPETQMFAFLDVVRGQAAPPYAGLLLQHRTRPVVTPCGVLPSPLDQARHGVLDACDQDAFAASLLYSDSGILPTERVVLTCLSWELSLESGYFHRYLINGVNDKMAPMEVRSGVRPRRQPRRPAADDADFLGDMVQDMRRDVRRRIPCPGAGRRPLPPAAAPLPDLELPEDVGELQEMLRGAFVDEAGTELERLLGEVMDMEVDEEVGPEFDSGGDGDEEAGEPEAGGGGAAPGPAGAAGGEAGPAPEPAPAAAAANGLQYIVEDPPSSLRFKLRGTEREIARLYVIGATGVKAVCKRHKHCYCFARIPAATSIEQACADLAQWVDFDEQSADDHAAAASRLKVDKFGMRLRPGAGRGR